MSNPLAPLIYKTKLNRMKMEFIKRQMQRPGLPYLLLFTLFALQFTYIHVHYGVEKPDYFWGVCLFVLGVLLVQIFRNGRVFHLIITTLFTLLIAYLALAFLSDLVKSDAYDWRFFRFLILGILLFGLLLFIESLLFRSKPERNF